MAREAASLRQHENARDVFNADPIVTGLGGVTEDNYLKRAWERFRLRFVQVENTLSVGEQTFGTQDWLQVNWPKISLAIEDGLVSGNYIDCLTY